MVSENSIVNKKAFSEMVGVSRPAITKACKANRLGMVGKKINLDHRKTKEYIKSHSKPAQPAKKKKPAVKPPPKPEPPPEKITAPVDNEPELPADPDEPDNGYSLPPGINCFEDITIHNLHRIPHDLIKKIKEFETAAKAKQAREQSRGELIKREIVKQAFSQVHTVDTNQWKTLEDKIMPAMCGIFDVQDGGSESIAARKLISDEVTKILKYSKRLIDEFFDGQEVDG